jgi:hypothetical protein
VSLIIAARPFTDEEGLLAGEVLDNCHDCGQPVARAAGIMADARPRVILCSACNAGRAFAQAQDPRAGDGCVCGPQRVSCDCGRGCTLCGGELR